MRYTVRFAHLSEPSHLRIGDKVRLDDPVGKMGSTGDSTAAHLHKDAVEGIQKRPWKLADAELGKVKPAPRQLNRFPNKHLFNGTFRVTTPYCDYQYQNERGKLHTGYDVSTDEKWPWEIFWSIKEEGEVVFNGYDAAYGNCLLVTFEAA